MTHICIGIRPMHFFKALLFIITFSCISLAISDRSNQPLRFWIDEYNFSKGETQLLRDSISSSNGTAHLIGETLASFLTTKGHQALPTFDIYWTGKRGCYLAFQQALNKHHLVTCAPGLDAITGKSDLIYSLVSAYGQDTAAFIVPRSYRLPSQYYDLAQYIQNNNKTSSTKWIMKQNIHRGKGVKVVPASQVLQHALIKDNKNNNSREQQQQYVLAQEFIANQYLIANRPFYIRVWAVVTGLYPLKLYLYDGGVVVFGSEQNNTTSDDTDTNSMIVNLWTQDRKAALPWGLPQLKAHIADDAAYTILMRKLQTSLAATVASAYPAMQRRTASSAPGHQGGSLEIIGVDYLVDDSMHPWLVEVNWLPSLARKVLHCDNNNSDNNNDKDCQYDNPFDIEKQKFVSSLLQLLIQRHGYIDTAERKASKIVSDAENEMCLDADDIEQLMLAQMEGTAAVKLGFINLTSLVYQGLACMSSYGGDTDDDTDADKHMCKDTLLSILDRKKVTENAASQKDTVTTTVLSQQQQQQQQWWWWWAIDWSVAYSSVIAKRVHGKKEYQWDERTRALMHIIMLEEGSSRQFWRSSESLTLQRISEACKVTQ